MKINSRLFKSFFFFSLILIFASCSQNLPEVNSASASVIFEYEDDDSAPKARFSVFVEAQSDAHRFAQLKVFSEESGFEWTTDNIVNIKENDVTMSGYTNFTLPEGEQIPKGKYTAVFCNADEEQTETEFYINYDSKIYELKSDEVADFMKKHYGLNKISIYDDSKVLIYFGDRTGNFRTVRDIWNNYQNAATYNDIWYENGNSVICILPEEYVKLDKSDDEKVGEKVSEE